MIATARRLLLDNASPGHPHRVTTRGDPTVRGSAYVYGRAREPCTRCGTPIRVERQGALNRPTYWCPRCQPATSTAPPTSPPARGSRRTAPQ
jgi:endonuclease-8